ncbi:MAG TPA: GFA family protein [Myxococcaceae bacterium]|nr:GFA family protein [Myxococcaceae bacterium]
MVRIYEGRCHCGAVRFRFRSEEIARGLRCNCSICIRKGAVMSLAYVPPSDMELLEGKDALEVYCWGDRTVNNYFCRTCGIHPFHEVIRNPGFLRFNLGCIEGLDPLALPIELIDGRAF